MRKLAYAAAGLAVVLAAGAGTAAAIGSNTHAGPQGDGTGITPVGWRVTPVGQQTTLGSLPTASALSPDGELLVLNAGDHPIESLQVVDAASRKVTQTISYTTPAGLYAGVAFSPDGTHAYASGGGSARTWSRPGWGTTPGATTRTTTRVVTPRPR
jgi:DNA-binding beta-propeller fold protein YncE